MNSTKKKRRMRLPNGIGSVHKIGDNKRRRKPWRARVPDRVEIDPDTGNRVQKYITIGYYATEKEAITALFDYQRVPFTAEAAAITFSEVYALWKEKKYPELSNTSQKTYNLCFSKSQALHNMKMRDIRTSHMDSIMDKVVGKYQMQRILRSFWSQLFRFSIERDFVQKDYAAFVTTRDKSEPTNRTAIPREDQEKLWAAADAGNRDAEIVLIYIYTGMRASELLLIQKKDVDLSARIMVGGLKTQAGKNRRIPIHTAILPFVARLMQTPGEFLVMFQQKSGKWRSIDYRTWFRDHWQPLMDLLGMTYTCHYTRHTCATMMREADVAEDLRKLILGHANGDITDRYTHHTDAMILAAIDRLPGRK